MKALRLKAGRQAPGWVDREASEVTAGQSVLKEMSWVTILGRGKSPRKSQGQENVSELTERTANRTTGLGFPGGAVVKNPPANAKDTGSSPGPGRSHMLRSN